MANIRMVLVVTVGNLLNACLEAMLKLSEDSLSKKLYITVQFVILIIVRNVLPIIKMLIIINWIK
jgi:hypothetical protein